jgi:predicted alpha/beta hydrolase family esterase
MSIEAKLQRRLEDFDVLVLPGWKNSGPAHWQTLWEDKFPEWQRVQQANWAQPQRAAWIAALDAAVAACRHPVVVVAHSLGCVTLAHWAQRHGARGVAAALLVAPADVERQGVATSLKGFAPLPQATLPFPSLLIASDNDHACSAGRAAQLAQDWGSDFHLLQGAGHINADSGLGEWEEGQAHFADWLAQAFPVRASSPLRTLRWVA